MIEFLDLFRDPSSLNRLLKAVREDLRSADYLAGCKALGLIGKLVTGPLWRLIGDKSIHMADFLKLIKQLISSLDSIDYNKISSGEFLPPESLNWTIKRDVVYNKLETRDSDPLVIEKLKVIVPAITKLLQEQYESLFNGPEVMEALRETTKSVVLPKNNKFAKFVFAYAGQILRYKPNISHLAQNAYLVYCLNKTDKWLHSRSEAERTELIKYAMSKRPSIHPEYLKMKAEIKAQREANLEQKMKELERRARRMKTES